MDSVAACDDADCASAQGVRTLSRIQVAIVDNTNEAWKQTMRAIRMRLRLGTQKIADVLQRCKLARSTVISMITFVARRVWPDAKLAQRLQKATHNFVWSGRLAEKRSGSRRAQLSTEHSQLGLVEGRMGEPSVRTELMVLAARAVSIWAKSRSRLHTSIGQILLRRSDDRE